MKIFNTLEQNSLFFSGNTENKGLSLALGFFDGVHLAHKKILSTAVSYAKENHLKSAVVTFQKSPGGYFDPKKNVSLQTLEDRLSLIEKTGIDYAFVLDFLEFKNLSAEDYLNNVLIKKLASKFIVTGFNHTFGLNRKGDSAFLRENEGFYRYVEVEKMRINNTLVSSTNIKKFIEKAYIKEANSILGYDFNIKGKVEHGLKLARELGYKTANISWPENIVKPPYGVYFGEVEYSGKKYKSLINWGIKPTIGSGNAPVAEAHLIGFDKEIYGETIKVCFKTPIRAEKKFNSTKELKEAISADIDTALSLKL